MVSHPKWGIGLFFLLLVFSTNAFALFVCQDISLFADPKPPAIINISAPTNAHVELGTQTNYSIQIGCADQAAVPVVTVGLNPTSLEIMHLSNLTNAHAEVEGESFYTAPPAQNIEVRDNGSGSLSVQTVNSTTCPGGALSYVPFIRLSDVTNAHVQSPTYMGPDPLYPWTICLAYDATGSGPSDNILTHTILNAPATPVTLGDAFVVNLNTDRPAVVASPTYTSIKTIGSAGVCWDDPALVGPLNDPCEALTDYFSIVSEFSDFATQSTAAYQAGGGILIPESVALSGYATAGVVPAAYVPIVAAFLTNHPTNPIVNANDLETLADPHVIPYGIDTGPGGGTGGIPLNLSGGTYRIVALQLAPYYTFNLFPNNLENSTAWNDNIDIASFTISSLCNNGIWDAGLGEVCDASVASGITGCTLPQTCNLTCTACDGSGGGPGSGGSGGDVYVVKQIDFPQLYQDGVNDITFQVTIENKQMALTGDPPVETLLITIRDSKGQKVPGFDQEPFSLPSFSSGATQVVTEPIEVASGAGTVLNAGETYTLYATAEPYEDPDPVTGGDQSEGITGNNSGFKTFTVLTPTQNVSVPDAPWWMSLVMVSIVLGWLFFSQRKEE